MKRFLLHLFIGMCACTCAAIPFDRGALRNISIDQGLTGDCVYCLLKDSRGLTWVGTNNGISLYDGRHVTSIPCPARRSQNLVRDLAELPDGSVVAAMRAGLYQVDMETLEARRVCPSLSEVRSLLPLGDTLLVGSGNGLALVMPAHGWQAETLTLGSSRMARDNNIVDVCSDGQGGAWAISASAFYRLDRRLHVTPVKADFTPVRDGLRCICAVGERVYIGTSWQGLLCYTVNDKQLRDVPAIASGVVADLHADTEGRLFVSLDGAGAVVLDTRSDSILQRYVHDGQPSGLPSNSVYTFWQDAETGVSFFGFFRQGMAHSLNVCPIAEAYRRGTLDSEQLSVRSFCRHDAWTAIGTREGLWLVDERTDASRYFDSTAMGGSNVLSIAWFAGRFVVATFDGGLCLIDPGTGLSKRPDEAVLRKGNFTKVGVIPASGGTRLMAISDRIVILDEQFRIVSTFDSRNSELTGGVLVDFLFDQTGKAWLSSVNGLALYDPANGVVQRTGFPDGFFDRELSMGLSLDRNGDVLAVSENNLYRSRPDLTWWDSLEVARRLDVGNVSFVVPQGDGYWLGTDRGLFLMDSLFVRFRHFGLAEGLASLFCNTKIWQVDAEGSFWFSTDHGLYCLKPADAVGRPKGHAAAPLYLAEIKVDGRPLPLADCLQASARPLSVGWNFGQEPVEITAQSLGYADERAAYLEWCVDDGPMQVATERQPIRIAGLRMGRHRLHVYRPGDAEPQTFVLSVWPNSAFWFEVVFALLLLVSIPLLLQYQRRVARFRVMRRKKRALEKELYAHEAVQRHVREEEARRREAEEARKAAMYQHSRSSQEENRRLLRALRTLMEVERPYRQADLRVADVARSLGSTPNKVSQMLSQYAQVSFYDFINDYRIEEFKRRALNDRYAHLSTLAIAETCGFKKTTFYVAFAKKESCTPAEWLARQGRKR